MSAAIMHTTSLYDFGDFFLKNQSQNRSTKFHAQQQQQVINSNANIGNTLVSANSLNNNIHSATSVTSVGNGNNSILPYNHAQNPLAAASPAILQQHINAVVAQQQQDQHQQHKMLSHNALSRTVSVPQGTAQSANVVSLVNTLMENLVISNGHRKLERTQSEPLPQVNTSRYKTELCRPFEEAGECKYGEKCQFAHGMHELRNLQRHPKYKTEFCRTFHSVGFCPYGPRCHFVHNADEARHHNRAVHAAYTRLTAVAVAAAAQQQQQRAILAANAAATINHQLPLTPPLSMSTGSDRGSSPTGSLSLSPTNSMASFAFADQMSPANSMFAKAFTFNTPPSSPPGGVSPVSTPPPQNSLVQQQKSQQSSNIAQQTAIAAQTIHTKHSQSIIAAPHTQQSIGNQSIVTEIDARLPVFNRLSSNNAAADAFTNLSI